MEADTLVERFDAYHRETRSALDRLAKLESAVKDATRAADEAREQSEHLESKINRQGLYGSAGPLTDARGLELRAAVNAWARGHEIESRGMQSNVGPDGGFAVPGELDTQMIELMRALSPMRQVAEVQTISSPEFEKLINKKGTTSGWKTETGTPTPTGTPQLGKFSPSQGEIYAMPSVTQRLLDDAAFDVEAWLLGEISEEFAIQEAMAFVRGDGILKPKGFLAYKTGLAKDDTRAIDTIQHIKSGNSSGLDVSTGKNGAEKLVDLLYSLRPVYRSGPGVAWMMNSKTAGEIRKLKDAQNNFIWQQSNQAGQPSMLLGYPVVEDEQMPDIGANAFPVAFGNWRKAYLIVDRVGMRLVRDPYTAKGFVIFYCTKRTGGGVQNTQALKFLKIEA